MARAILSIFVLLVAVAGGFYQLYLKPIFVRLGHGRIIQPVANKDCTTVPELQACEKLIIHQPTGVLYLACSTPTSRASWTPAVGRLNASAASRDDYIATYDPKSSRVTRLNVEGYRSDRGFSFHGLDVVPSSANPSDLFVYAVNHRAPLGDQDASVVGADSAIELFKTKIGSTTLTHIKTFEDPVIITPNDVIGASDGQSFFFTNDHGEKTGLIRELDIFGRKSTSVAYCHLTQGCKFAITGMHSNNGIARAPNGTIYVADSSHGGLTILEPQIDNTLVITDKIDVDRPMDNLSVDSEGHVWAAAFPDALLLIGKHFNNHTVPCPASAFRFSINTGPDSFYGAKYKVEKVFEDDGSIASGITSVAYDTERHRLYLHGIASPHLAICRL